MAKQSNQKLKLLYLLRILGQSTDEGSGMTLTQILAELEKYNVSAGRKSVYDDIEALRLFGIDVRVKRDRYVKYYIGKRDLSFVELKYIIDALENFNALDFESSRELSEKLVKLFGVKGREYASCSRDDFKGAERPKVLSEELDKSITLLSEAIRLKSKVRFRTFEWNSLKQRILQNGGEYLEVTPLRIEYDGGYILRAFDGNDLLSYPVNRMSDVEAVGGSLSLTQDISALSDAEASVNKYETVRLCCEPSYCGKIFERFGFNVTVLSSRSDLCELAARVKVDNEFFAWLFVNAQGVRLISPESAVLEYNAMLEKALKSREG